MAAFNRVILVGNLTRDPELRHAPTGSAVAEMRLAVSETYRDRQSGQPKEVVCYVDVIAWDRQAETCSRYLTKGSKMLVEGRLVYDEWKNKQGESRNRLRVRADRVQFLGSPPGRRDEAQSGAAQTAVGERPAVTSGGGETSGGRPAAAAAPVQPPATEDVPPENGGDDEDLPF
ncbi:MAG: single-stranded DNA-binding protein [Kiritimatiellae bacterium]|nr:single-stranded DNA-binding protein [Kiritimatiellia bacterium]